MIIRHAHGYTGIADHTISSWNFFPSTNTLVIHVEGIPTHSFTNIENLSDIINQWNYND